MNKEADIGKLIMEIPIVHILIMFEGTGKDAPTFYLVICVETDHLYS